MLKGICGLASRDERLQLLCPTVEEKGKASAMIQVLIFSSTNKDEIKTATSNGRQSCLLLILRAQMEDFAATGDDCVTVIVNAPSI